MTTREFRGIVSLRCNGDEDCVESIYIDEDDVVAVLSEERFHQGRVRAVLDDVELGHGEIDLAVAFDDDEGDYFLVDDTNVLEHLHDHVDLYVHLIVTDDLQSPVQDNIDHDLFGGLYDDDSE